MNTRRTIELRLPEGIDPGEADVSLLRATLEAMLMLRCDRGEEWKSLLHELKDDGWQVSWGLSWSVEARRDRDFEQASGATLDDAFEHLRQLTRLDSPAQFP